jgi:hypothetical protein
VVVDSEFTIDNFDGVTNFCADEFVTQSKAREQSGIVAGFDRSLAFGYRF